MHVMLVVLFFPVPEPVGGLMCTSVSSSSLTVNWPPSASPVLSYQVEVRRYTAGDQGVSTVVLASPYDKQHTITSATINGLGIKIKFSIYKIICVYL